MIPSKDGTLISYEVYGTKEPTLVFVHGWCGDSRYWRAQVPFFSKTYRVVTVDLAGHGHSGMARKTYSMASFGEDVKAVTETVGSNKVILIGNVGKDPDVRYLEGNVPVCRFPLATSESYRNRSGENVTQTEWHNIVLWRGLAEIAQKFVKKGTPLYIEGRISTRSFDDKDGNKRYVTEIVASNIILLGRKPDQQAGEEGKMAGGLEPGEPSVPEGPSPQPQDDDLPF